MLDLEVNWRVTCQRWRQVDLHQPGLQVGIDQDIEPKQLKAVVPRLQLLELGLNRSIDGHHRLEDHIIDLRPQQIVVDAHLFHLLVQSSEAPLVAFITNISVLVLYKFLALLIDGIVG